MSNTKDPTVKDDLILKLTGKAEIPSRLEIGDNYTVKFGGTITAITENDRHDGGRVIYYKIEPVSVELITHTGTSIKAKDTRSESQLYRGLIKKIWIEKGIDEDFETFYKKVYKKIYKYTDTLVNEVLNEKN